MTMDTFFHNLPTDDAIAIEELSRLMFEIRSARQLLLAQGGAADEAALLERIAQGSVAEHPMYEHYLSIRILGDLQHAVRDDLLRRTSPTFAAGTAGTATGFHLVLAGAIDQAFGHRLEAPVDVKLDALLLRLDNGVSAEIRIAAADAYSIAWTWGDVLLRIDTSPSPTRPGGSHLHLADGSQRDDPVTHCGTAPWANLEALLEMLLEDPLLARFDAPR